MAGHLEDIEFISVVGISIGEVIAGTAGESDTVWAVTVVECRCYAAVLESLIDADVLVDGLPAPLVIDTVDDKKVFRGIRKLEELMSKQIGSIAAISQGVRQSLERERAFHDPLRGSELLSRQVRVVLQDRFPESFHCRAQVEFRAACTPDHLRGRRERIVRVIQGCDAEHDAPGVFDVASTIAGTIPPQGRPLADDELVCGFIQGIVGFQKT